VGAFFRRLRARVKYWDHERQLARELEVHREMSERHHAEDAETRRKVSLLLGNTTIAREDARAVWVARWLQQLIQDLRYGARGLARRPTFTLTALSMLVLGLGLTASLFAVFNAMFLRPWPVPDAGRVFVAESTWMQDHVRVTRGARMTFSSLGLPYASWPALKSGARAADYTFVELNTFRVPFETKGGFPFLRGAFVADNFFDVMRVPMQLGRAFSDASPSSEPAAVLTDSTWRQYFGGDTAIVGNAVMLSGVRATIVGVTAPGFEGLQPDELNVLVAASSAGKWTQIPFASNLRTNDATVCCLELRGRLRPGFSRAQASADLTFLMQRYAADHGVSPTSVTLRSTAALFRRGIDGDTATLLALVTAGCLLVWLLACTNVWNLELARGLERGREIMVRLSLGAGRGRIVRQFLTEGLILASMAGVLAYLVTAWLPGAIMNVFGGASPFGYQPDARVAIVIAALAVAAALLFSMAPALHVTRARLRGGPLTLSHSSGRLRHVMLAMQIAIGAVLILTGALLTRSVSNALNGHADFAVGSVSVVTISPPPDNPAYSDHLQLRAAWARTTESLASAGVPFAAAMQAPISNRKMLASAKGEDGRIFQTLVYAMAAGGMAVLDVPIVAGHNYSDAIDRREIVVNEAFAHRMWPGSSPLGKSIDLDYPEAGRYTVVGVARNAHLTSFGEMGPMVHRAMPKSVPIQLQAVLRRDATAEASVRKIIAEHDPALSVSIVPLSDSIRRALRDSINGATIASSLGAIALLLAIVGIFGVFSFVVEERRREIGIRLALGADRTQLSSSILRRLLWPLASGLAAGLALSALAGLALRGYLLGISPLDPIAYAAALAILTFAALAAAFVPMRRALRLDPAITLRQE